MGSVAIIVLDRDKFRLKSGFQKPVPRFKDSIYSPYLPFYNVRITSTGPQLFPSSNIFSVINYQQFKN